MQIQRAVPQPPPYGGEPRNTPWLLRLMARLETENSSEPLTMHTILQYAPASTPWGLFPNLQDVVGMQHIKKQILGTIQSLRAANYVESVPHSSPRSYVVTPRGRARLRDEWGF
jgi:hypothetical protein